MQQKYTFSIKKSPDLLVSSNLLIIISDLLIIGSYLLIIVSYLLIIISYLQFFCFYFLFRKTIASNNSAFINISGATISHKTYLTFTPASWNIVAVIL